MSASAWVDHDWIRQPASAKKGYKKGHGLSHIIVRRALEGEDGGETLVRMIDVLANGKLGRRYGPRNGERVDVELNGYTAVVSLYRFGNKEAWRLTGFKGLPGAQRVSVKPIGLRTRSVWYPAAGGFPACGSLSEGISTSSRS